MNIKTLKTLWVIGLAVILIAGAFILYAPGQKQPEEVKPAVQRAQYEIKVKEPLAEASAGDPMLKKFAGISWDMTREELTEKFGRGLVDSESSLVYRENNLIYGTVTHVLALRDGKLSMVLVSVSAEDQADMLRLSYNARYGSAMTASYTYAMMGKLKEDPKSGVLAWRSTDTVICMNGGSINYVPATKGKLVPEE